jgi:methylmalonyl-CoA mutase
LWCFSQFDAAIEAITQACESGEGNLLALSIDAARARASVGEITEAMEKVYGRYVASDRMVSGAYKTEYGDQDDLSAVMAKVEVSFE